MKTGGWVVVAVVTAVCAGGCSRSVQSLDEAEFRMPLIRKALTMQRTGDSAGAIQAYRSALDSEPRIARAHLGLAFLLDKPDGDYVLALYHYRRYLDLRPTSEKREIIEKRIRMCRTSLVRALSSDTASGQDLDALRAENAGLKAKVRELDARLAAAETRAGARSAPRTYVVQSGDTLRRIAARMYEESERWPDLYRANRDSIADSANLRVGQVLVVPR